MKKKPRKPNAEYKLKPADLSLTTRRVLSLDPGSRNMGISCVGVDKKDRIQVLANSILTNPITHLTSGFHASLLVYLKEVDRWVRMYQPHGLVMERFQTRGTGGPLIELVSVMIGSICTAYKHLPCKMIVASQWKNQFHRRFEHELDAIYRELLVTPHQLDSSLIGCYGLEAGLRRELRYSPESIVRKVEASSLLPLRNRRIK
jgi:hypothetical protein